MEKHHTLLANTYAVQILNTDPEMQNNDPKMEEMRHKLQQFLWQSSFYDADAVYGKETPRFNSSLLRKCWGKSAALFTL